jgi:hypothetical protein
MIYPQHVFVALASLTSLVSAAPVNKRETGLVGVEPISLGNPEDRGKTASVSLPSDLNPSDYSTECYNAWTAFDHGRCWCHTGCALDCTNGGVPGKAGSVIHPQWCEESMHLTKDACESITVSLTEACADVMDDKTKAPGLADVCETAGYDACKPKPKAATVVKYGTPCPAGMSSTVSLEACKQGAADLGLNFMNQLTGDTNWQDGCFQWYPDPAMQNTVGTDKRVYFNVRPGATTGNYGGHPLCTDVAY